MSASMPQPTRGAAPQPLPLASCWHVALAIVMMLMCLVGAELLRPDKYVADQVGDPELERMIPRQFGDWELNALRASTVVDPVVQQSIQSTYSATLSRVYVHRPSGREVMLSLAYGRDQSLATQAHVPEACYGGIGFRINERRESTLATPYGGLKVVRLMTNLGLRVEPLTYFIRVGDRVARGSLERNLQRLRYAARGIVVDGLLFRVSEITTRHDAFDLQDAFVNDLLGAVAHDDRQRLIGSQGDWVTR